VIERSFKGNFKEAVIRYTDDAVAGLGVSNSLS
jgi:hypothetical protein